MLYEPSELKAAEKATSRSGGCRSETRALFTPAEELKLALELDPQRGRKAIEWINPKLAAVYVITAATSDLCKIGYAQDVRKRMLGIQGSCPFPVHLRHFVYVVGPLIAKRVEGEVHDCLEKERQHGEWFDISPAYAAAMIHAVIKERGFIWWDERGRRQLGYDAAHIHKRDWERFARRPYAA
jgi:hypothetical protein